MAQFEMSWQAPEFEYRARDVSWYWLTIIVAAAMVAFAVWQKDFLFGFFIVIAEVLAIVWANRTPRMIEFRVSDRELLVGSRKRYVMGEIESFATGDSDDEFAEMFFHFKGKLRMPLIVRVPAAQQEEVSKNLRLVLREIEHQPSFVDSLEKLIGF